MRFAMFKMPVFALVPALALFACASRPAPVSATQPRQVAQYIVKTEPTFAEGSQVPDVTLRDAAQERVGVDELGPAVVVKTWTWHPHGEEPYVVWITCRGQGAERVCGLAAAAKVAPGSGEIKMTAFTHLGFSNPNVECAGDKLELVGDDLRGAWTQVLEVVQDGTLKMGKRQYSSAP
ncbi:MAG: hypothetical protein ACXWUG_29535 [Polyangiales bacterium]